MSGDESGDFAGAVEEFWIVNRVGWLLLDLYTLYTISLKSSMMYIRQIQILVQAQICTWLIVYTKNGPHPQSAFFSEGVSKI